MVNINWEMSNDDSSPDDYYDEARDVVNSLKNREVVRTRSMSPNHFSAKKREILKRSRRNGTAGEKVEGEENRNLEDLPRQELEGAPPGWGDRRERMPNATSLPKSGRRNSAFPTSISANRNIQRSSVVRGRRASQMTFDEWCQLKKFQAIHESAVNAEQTSKGNSEAAKNIKRNISYDEWSKISEEKLRQESMIQKEKKQREEEEKEARENAKFRRRMSFDQWRTNKDAEKISQDKGDVKEQPSENGQCRKQKAEEEYQKWMIKKEMEEIKKDREILLRMHNASLNPVASNKPGQRRASLVGHKELGS